MKLYQILLPVLIGALIGYCTNYIAIKMLFRPRKAWYIGKWKVPMTPGVIPKNKARLASAVGNAVSDRLLTRQDILDGVKDSGLRENIVSAIVAPMAGGNSSLRDLTNNLVSEKNLNCALDDLSGFLGQKIINGIKAADLRSMVSEILQPSLGLLLSNPMVAMFLGGVSMDAISEQVSLAITGYLDANGQEKMIPMVRQELEGMLNQPVSAGLEAVHLDERGLRQVLEKVMDRFLDGSAANLLACIDVKGIVEAKINSMDVKELEDLVMSVMKNELQTVVNLGALIGAIIGAVNILI